MHSRRIPSDVAMFIDTPQSVRSSRPVIGSVLVVACAIAYAMIATVELPAQSAVASSLIPPWPARGQAMLRALLVDRFKVIAHQETRELPAYELVLARKDGALGPQL